jgi:DNA-directed RNA polymerase specialized sigma subunit
MQSLLNSIKYTSSIEPDDIRKNLKMKTVLRFVQAKEENPNLTKDQICKKIGISDSSLKRTMKDLNMKSFYRHDVPVNKRNKKKDNNKDNENQNEMIKEIQQRTNKKNIKEIKGGFPSSNVKDYDAYKDLEEMNKNLLGNK